MLVLWRSPGDGVSIFREGCNGPLGPRTRETGEDLRDLGYHLRPSHITNGTWREGLNSDSPEKMIFINEEERNIGLHDRRHNRRAERCLGGPQRSL